MWARRSTTSRRKELNASFFRLESVPDVMRIRMLSVRAYDTTLCADAIPDESIAVEVDRTCQRRRLWN